MTHDPLVLAAGLHNLFVDLGAERMLGAEKNGERIAVEIKTFVSRSEVEDLARALGQYLIYRSVLRRKEPERHLFLAVPQDAYDSLLSSLLGRMICEDYAVRLLVFDPVEEVIRQWQT